MPRLQEDLLDDLLVQYQWRSSQSRHLRLCPLLNPRGTSLWPWVALLPHPGKALNLNSSTGKATKIKTRPTRCYPSPTVCWWLLTGELPGSAPPRSDPPEGAVSWEPSSSSLPQQMPSSSSGGRTNPHRGASSNSGANRTWHDDRVITAPVITNNQSKFSSVALLNLIFILN